MCRPAKKRRQLESCLATVRRLKAAEVMFDETSTDNGESTSESSSSKNNNNNENDKNEEPGEICAV